MASVAPRDQKQQMSAKASEQLNLPAGIKFYTPYPFGGMNLEASPPSIDDKEFVYLENFVKLGDGNLRTVWDAGPAFYTAPLGQTIVYYMYYTIASSYYCFVVLSNGTAVQINMTTGAQTPFGAANEFYNAGSRFLPIARQWASTYLLIANRNTPNDYWAWDGNLLYGPGTTTPNGVVMDAVGSGYSTSPAITVFGGSGYGFIGNAVISNGGVVEVQILNPGTGYLPGETVQLAFSGGGANNTPILEAVLTATTVAGVSMVSEGSGYNQAPAVILSGGGGVNASALVSVDTSGHVSSIIITDPGQNYTTAPAVTIVGTGTGATAAAVLSGAVKSVSITSGGSYNTPSPSVVFSGGGGSGAAGVATTSYAGGFSFTVTSVVVTNPGSGYTSAPSVSIAGGSPSAVAVAVIAQTLTSITVLTPGFGYAPTPTVTFTGGGGTGVAGTAIVTWGVAAISVVSGGSGYTSTPIVTITGVGTGATAQAVIANGVVTAINVTNPGQNYTTPPSIVVTGGGGGGATATSSITGVVSAVYMTNNGTGYTGNPQVVIAGAGGTGALGQAVLIGTTLNTVTIVNGGTGFTAALTATATVVGGGGSGATLTLTTSGGAITSYTVGAKGSGYTTTPAIVVAPGANNAAYATLTLMPWGVSGSALEVYNSQVWLFDPAVTPFQTITAGSQYSFTAPGTIWNFATSAGGGSAQSTDSFLQTTFVNARQSAGYLYTFGDGSVSVISNVTTTTSSSG